MTTITNTQLTIAKSPLDPLVEALAERLLPRLSAEIEAKFKAAEQTPHRVPVKRLYSIRDLGRIYGVGRIQVARDIREGRIRAVERPVRGGRIGVFVTTEEAERKYAGKTLTGK